MQEKRGKKRDGGAALADVEGKAVAGLAPPSSARPPALPYTGKRHIRRRRRSGMWEKRRKAGEEAEERQESGGGGRLREAAPSLSPAVDAHFLAQLPLLIALALQDLGAVFGLVGFLLQRLDLALHRLQRSCSGCHPSGGGGGGEAARSGIPVPKKGDCERATRGPRGGSGGGGGGEDAAPVLAGGKQLGRGFDVSTAGGRGRDVATAGPAVTNPLGSPFGSARWGLRGGKGLLGGSWHPLLGPSVLGRLLSPKRLLSGSKKGGSGLPHLEVLGPAGNLGSRRAWRRMALLSASAPSSLARVPALSRCLVQERKKTEFLHQPRARSDIPTLF